MPLNKECSAQAFRENMEKELQAGKPRDQAFAIAISTLEEACQGGTLPTELRNAKAIADKLKAGAPLDEAVKGIDHAKDK